MAPKRPLRIPLHTNNSSRFLTSPQHQSPLLSLASRLSNPSSRRPLLLLALATLATYYFILPALLPSSVSFSASPRARRRARRPAPAFVPRPDPTLPKLGRDFSLTPYLDARWPAGPAGIEHLAHATPSELALSGLTPEDIPPYLWLTVYTPRTRYLAQAVERLNDLRRRGSPPGETLTGRSRAKAVPLGKGAAGEKVLDLEGLGLGVTGRRKGEEPVVRETRLVVVCAEGECERECEKEGWWCYAGYAGRGTTPGNLVKLKIETLLEAAKKRDVFFVSSDTKLTEDPYPKLEPLLLTHNIIVQDPPDRADPGSGDFGTAFYWFRRGRRGPDAWNAVLRRVDAGELAMAEADKKGINQELGSSERVQPMSRDELDSWAALPASARRRRLSAVFGGDRGVRVMPANGVVLEPSVRLPGAAPVRTHDDERAEQRREREAARKEEEETEAEEEAAMARAEEESKEEMRGAAEAGLLTEEEEDYMRIVEGQEREAEAMGEAEGEVGAGREKRGEGGAEIRFEPEGDEE